ncbi:MAG: biotin carboxylase N-terminal domain-containing protein [Dehalococcoidia bacterium]
MFTSVLVANRGEIAVRICKTLRKMGIRSVVVASIPDRRSLAVRTADDWVLLEGYSAAESYLDVEAVIAAAKEKGCEAIHPGYGFLSERADFAERCAAEGIVFIGPPPEVLRGLGDKSAARRLAVDNGVPIVPGWDGADDDATLIAKAAEIGFPVMVKARGGGGGRGMRPVHEPAELPEAIESARREAEAAFGDSGLLLEKLVTNAHHVEVQVIADAHGNVIHLGERDCSVQRRRQKLIEETPSPIVDDALRAELTTAALKLARAVNYVNAGTFEFLVGEPPPSSEPRLPRSGRVASAKSSDNTSTRPFYFLEVNPRLQVEHPVTEMVTGLDLVELQLRIAAGEPLPLTQEDVTFTGHAIEFRINAEDPWNDFRPSSGRITFLSAGEHQRWDSGYVVDDRVPAQYDSLVSKQIGHAGNRRSNIQSMARILRDYRISGIRTNLALLAAIASDQEFRKGRSHTAWVEERLERLLLQARREDGWWLAAAGAVAVEARRGSRMPGSIAPSLGAFASPNWFGAGAVTWWLDDNNVSRSVSASLNDNQQGLATVDGNRVEFSVLGREHSLGPGTALYLEGDNATYSVSIYGDAELSVFRGYGDSPFREMAQFRIVPPPPLPRRAHATAEGATAVTAPLAGTIATVRVAAGDEVEAGDLLLTLDAMKMEHRIAATAGGTVAALHVAAGDVVREGDVLVEVA